jgi:hypothetical protein
VNLLRNEKSYSLLDDFVHNVNMLNGDGLELKINNELKTYSGFLAFVLGDTPAFNWLGGFKEGVAKAEKFCRRCDIKNGDVLLVEKQSILRKLTTHKARLEKLKNVDMNKHIELSKEFGINSESLLLKINDFDVCKCLLQDPMHVFFEGICHLELKCLLEYSINKNKAFLAYLNDKIINFNYNKHDKTDKPNEIDNNAIKNGFFTQTSGQMSVLYHNLPLMIGDRYENSDKHWANYLRLLKIINLTFAFNYNEKTIEYLSNEI